MTLDVIFHKARAADAGGDPQPHQHIPESEAPGFYHPSGEYHDHQQQPQRTQHLHHADEAIAPEKQLVIPGTVQHDLGHAVKQQENQCRVPILPLFFGQVERKQNQKQHQRRHGLQNERRQTVLRSAGNGVGHGIDPGKRLSGSNDLPPVSGIEEAGKPPHGDTGAPGHGHAVQHLGQIPVKMQQANNNCRQYTSGEDAQQGISAGGEGLHGGFKAVVAAGAAVPVNQPPKQKGQRDGQGYHAEGGDSIAASSQIQRPEKADGGQRRQSQHDGTPVIDGLPGNKRDFFHTVSLLPASPWRSR